MGIGNALTELGRFLDDCERRGGTVASVDFEEVTDAGGERLRADVDLRVSVDPTADASLCDARVCPDGAVRFALDSTTELIPVSDHDVRVESTGSAFDDGAGGTFDDDAVTVQFAATVPAASGTGVGADGTAVADAAADATDPTGAAAAGDADARDESVAAVSGVASEADRSGTRAAERGSDPPETPTRDRGVPPFKDPDLLAEVYESCDTFAEMADTLEMDVTAETVRRYMIDYDIHEPNTYQTGGDAAGATADEQVVLSDGIGLPDDVTAEDLVETVERSNTIYEVKQDIDIDRDDALEMLQELNLLDLVVGRLATEGERDITREDIVDRLREASAVQ